MKIFITIPFLKNSKSMCHTTVTEKAHLPSDPGIRLPFLNRLAFSSRQKSGVQRTMTFPQTPPLIAIPQISAAIWFLLLLLLLLLVFFFFLLLLLFLFFFRSVFFSLLSRSGDIPFPA